MSKNDGMATRLDSDLLRSFLAIVEAGSVSGGAACLLRTQSAVSLQVQKLEATVGQRLFRRHGRGVSMTSAGEQLLPVARQVVEALDRTVVAMRSRKPQQEIRLGFPEEYCDTMLPPILAAFTRRRPDARVFLRCGSSTDFPRVLAAGDLDLALHSPPDVPVDDLVVHRESAVWAGSVLHDAATRRPLPVALFDKQCWWRERCLELLRRTGLDHQVVCTSESVAGVRAAIAAGIAVGVLPAGSLTSQLRPLTDGTLPALGGTSLVLMRSPAAPRELTDVLAATISAAFQSAAVF